MAMDYRSAPFGHEGVGMNLAVHLPAVSHDPFKAMIAVVNVRDETPQACSHFPSDTGLNVLVALGIGETVRYVSHEAH